MESKQDSEGEDKEVYVSTEPKTQKKKEKKERKSSSIFHKLKASKSKGPPPPLPHNISVRKDPKLRLFLKSCGLSVHASVFESNDIDYPILCTLSTKELLELGLTQ